MDPLSSLIALTRPQTVVSKVVTGSGRWAIRAQRGGNAGFGVILRGTCHLHIEQCEPVTLVEGDFILLQSYPGYILSSHPDFGPSDLEQGTLPCAAESHYGDSPVANPDFQLLGGYFRFSPINRPLLDQILPPLIHIRSANGTAQRLAKTISLLADEAKQNRAGRDLVLERLIEVLLVEALRYEDQLGPEVRPGLPAGLADNRIGRALTHFHAKVADRWSVASLAEEAGMSRTAFSERFTRLVGVAPMTYVLDWRMAIAKDILQRGGVPQESIAAAVGYQSASAFSTAFRRQVGLAPGEFARHPPVLLS
jgi:AraC-like DNA-binding protein